MVYEMTIEELENSSDMRYDKNRFGNLSIQIGKVVWVRVLDKKGTHTMPVKLIAARSFDKKVVRRAAKKQ